MVCIASLRNIVRTGNLTCWSSSGSASQIERSWWDLDPKLLVSLVQKNYPRFRAIGTLMAESGTTPDAGTVSNKTNMFPEKDCDEERDVGYASGGWKSEDGRLSCGYSSFRGKRASMEDFFDIRNSTIDGQIVNVFGIFDGHGGSRAAEFLKEHLFENLLKHPEFLTDTKKAICIIFFESHCCDMELFLFIDLFPLATAGETYKKTDSDFLDSESNTFRDDGSTASTAVLVGKRLYVANVGDSRAVVSKAGKALPLSDDHKPNRSDERKRIEDAGGVVMWAGTWRVGGVLAMSRAFGNRLLKQYVVAEPEIQEEEVGEDLDLLVLASDGLWDVVPNEDAISVARTEEEAEAAARKLTETAFSRGSADNITCIVVRFHHDTKEKENWSGDHQSI